MLLTHNFNFRRNNEVLHQIYLELFSIPSSLFKNMNNSRIFGGIGWDLLPTSSC